MIDVLSVEICTLPSVLMTEIASLPQCSGIYFIVNEAQEVLYIGQSVNIWARWRSHHIHRAVCDPEDSEESARFRAHWLTLADETERLALEVELIRRFRPALNSKHNGVHVHVPLANPLTDEERQELKVLIQQTKLTKPEVAEQLGLDIRSLVGYCNGTRRPSHFGALRKALQLIVLMQRGIITSEDLATYC